MNFIKKHSLAVIATVNDDGSPHASVVEFSETDQFEIVFDTFVDTRKYRNLKRDPRIAIVIGWDENITVQYEGFVIEPSEDVLEEAKKIHLTKLPNAKKYIFLNGTSLFRVRPKRIRYSDLNVYPWRIEELTF